MDRLRSFAWRPRTTVILTISLILILVSLVASFMISNFKPTTQVHIGSGVYSPVVARTTPELTQGLSSVKSIPMNGGLLMDFGTDGYHGIWMKDMNFPLDIVWLDKSKKVVYIVMNAPPENPATTVFKSKDPARYVLEVPAGSVKKSGIKAGMVADFNIDV